MIVVVGRNTKLSLLSFQKSFLCLWQLLNKYNQRHNSYNQRQTFNNKVLHKIIVTKWYKYTKKQVPHTSHLKDLFNRALLEGIKDLWYPAPLSWGRRLMFSIEGVRYITKGFTLTSFLYLPLGSHTAVTYCIDLHSWETSWEFVLVVHFRRWKIQRNKAEY